MSFDSKATRNFLSLGVECARLHLTRARAGCNQRVGIYVSGDPDVFDISDYDMRGDIALWNDELWEREGGNCMG